MEGFIQGKDKVSSTNNRMIHLPNVLSAGSHHITRNPFIPLSEKSKNLPQENQSETFGKYWTISSSKQHIKLLRLVLLTQMVIFLSRCLGTSQFHHLPEEDRKWGEPPQGLFCDNQVLFCSKVIFQRLFLG